uniref:Conotoxin-like unassigned superfamily 08 n=1 Tax=Conus ermineus TaxID=55423 RepID=A0A346CIR7_CONER|nr:conotoxin-like precursor unassigned superfamily 08 [Conus ermineus]
MKLFMFTAIIFTMASTTVTETTCENDKKACGMVLGNLRDTHCDCASTGNCIFHPAHKITVDDTLFYTCRKNSDFDICDGSQPVMNAALTQLNCRCPGAAYTFEGSDVICG